MGQVIHCHIEYLEYPEARYSYFGKIFLDQDYTFFALLGGGPQAGQFIPHFRLRGYPADANLFTNMAWFLLVSERESSLRRTVSHDEAEKWVTQEVARWVGNDCITDPDYFGPSWLEAKELNQIYSEYLSQTDTISVTVTALVSVMRSLPGARLVYWFGN